MVVLLESAGLVYALMTCPACANGIQYAAAHIRTADRRLIHMIGRSRT